MASNSPSPRWSAFLSSEHTQHKPRSRPLPVRVRTYSVDGPQSPEYLDKWDAPHSRHKSSGMEDNPMQRSPLSKAQKSHGSRTTTDGSETSGDDTLAGASESDDMSTPPTSPSTKRSSEDCDGPAVIPYDFSRIDYQIERAKVLGEGLWSTVYLAEQTPPRKRSAPKLPTPPTTPERRRVGSAPGLYAVKVPSRRDALEVFLQEARVLSRLQHRAACSQYVVPFYGLDDRNHALVFQAVIGGSLDNLVSRLKHMTEVSRHLELVSIFPGIAFDLISGLSFLHLNGVVHADIKPGNVLLDISEHCSRPTPVIRARYIDFSAAFIPDQGDSASNAGGTWSYMAPEQLRIEKEWNTPTFASDVWSLGITLLSVLVGASPYDGACGGNAFMLREAVKCGDPLGFARMDPVPQKRLAACQDFVDCCRLALKKDRDNRVTAETWMQWVEDQNLDV